MIREVYIDGGQLNENSKGTGSLVGGMYAYCFVGDDDVRIAYNAGLVFPNHRCGEFRRENSLYAIGQVFDFNGTIFLKEYPGITNMMTETISAWKALSLLPDGWSGVIVSDSEVTLKRLTGEYKSWNNIPYSLCKAIKENLFRLGAWQVRHVAGHPWPYELSQGYRETKRRDGSVKRTPVSIHNVFVDFLCNEKKDEYYQRVAEGKEVLYP